MRKETVYNAPQHFAQRMLETIADNKELNKLELAGFVKGHKKGKTMEMNINQLFQDVHKQYMDFCKAYGEQNLIEMKQTSADIRNSAGCFFLKLQETGLADQ